MAGRDRDEDEQQSVAWHNRTSTLLGASVAALAAIAIVVSSVLYVTRQSEPAPAPMSFVDTSQAATPNTTRPRSTATTSSITSTSPPATTDIDPAAPEATEATDEPEPESPTVTTRPPRTRDADQPTTRTRPRLNVTRTLGP
ncbi:hypothetical protein [Mycobacterium sp. SMC-4]|uniref:hypothetical protein n=1 Tax=Mycobacterium sp. SMC-4 TaxID=2857059 RepID=UPI0021B25DDB|nr:hypothetical protein [Mycobacterium sp. SMC-4]UXA18490.1 hypothetical protein KXD98_01850 [Mycobacterium sp. SMC-4]